jgi:hypothetical protein
VDMCKGKRKYDHEAPMTSSLSDCTWLEKEWKFRLSTWHPSLHSYFSFTWFIPLVSFLPLLFSLSLLFLSFFHSHIFFLFLYFSLFLFIFPSLDIFSKLSTLLFLPCIQSEILNKPCSRRDETLRVGCVQGMWCTKEMYRVGYGIWHCTGLSMWKSRYWIHDKASNKR